MAFFDWEAGTRVLRALLDEGCPPDEAAELMVRILERCGEIECPPCPEPPPPTDTRPLERQIDRLEMQLRGEQTENNRLRQANRDLLDRIADLETALIQAEERSSRPAPPSESDEKRRETDENPFHGGEFGGGGASGEF